MRYPEFLSDKGTIGFVAPSFGCATQPYKGAFESAVKILSDREFKIQYGPNCFEAKGIGISNTPDKCALELQEMYEAKSNDVLISCGGGELMCEILPYLDFVRLKGCKPKWFLGYSDNTNFTFLQTILNDTAAIYGPCAGAFGMVPWHQSIYDLLEVLQGKRLNVHNYPLWERESLKSEENPTATYNVTEKDIMRLYDLNGLETTENVDFSGRLTGGCMDVLVNLTGTSFDKVREYTNRYKEDGIVWFLESCDLNVMAIRRAMWQMDQAGWFENVSGFIIGKPLVNGQQLMGLDQYKAVMEVAKKYNVPVIMDAQIGHIAPSIPIISGAYARIHANPYNVSINMELK